MATARIFSTTDEHGLKMEDRGWPRSFPDSTQRRNGAEPQHLEFCKSELCPDFWRGELRGVLW